MNALERKKVRVAVLNTHPIQYFAPLYAFLNQSADLEVTAIYLSDISIRGGPDRGFGKDVKWDVPLLKGYPYQFVDTRVGQRKPGGFLSIVAPSLWSVIRRGDFDVLWVHGHSPAACLVAILAAKSVGMRVFMRCETHLDLRRPDWKAAVRRPILRLLYSWCDKLLAIGTRNKEFYQSLGLQSEKIDLVPYSVDNNRFMASSKLSDEERAAHRLSLSVDDDRPIIIFASKFQRRKNPHHLLEAVRQLHAEGRRFQLVLTGSGEMEPELRKLVRAYGIPNVHFTGFVNQSALPMLFAACDVFVLPSEDEPWGLVINEAMCAGLPIVAADKIGAVADLVIHGENGYRFSPGDVVALTGAIRTLIVDVDLRRRMSKRSLEIISTWGFTQCLSGLRKATQVIA